jgi:hypothetical protein
MKRLEDRKLITRGRVGRTSSITLLSEDGSGDAYTHPATARHQYLKLPHAYWTERHYETLSLPAKAILLVALSLRSRFPLPYERGPAWYGLSPDSTERDCETSRRRACSTTTRSGSRTTARRRAGSNSGSTSCGSPT